ncbi:hypothetical protein ACSS7Z_15010 [Microbacterium sp. A82]|uniref:hypothetical protein n=1 Tax=Microbacterium sp. A82 TaxID=3450452 RepID=UPI003F40C9AE
MALYPTVATDLSTWLSSRPTPGLYALEGQIGRQLVTHANVAVRAQAERIVVFLPGAQGPKSERRIPFFHRWTWQEDLPDAHVIALGDPAITINENLRGGWFIHDTYDLIAELASIAGRIADTLGTSHENVTFHGSSIGGFAAIGMAAHLKGSSALSEIPQIDVELWPFKGSQVIIESHFGQTFSELRRKHPERLNVLDRLRYADFVPPFTLITNTADATYDQQLSFMDDVAALKCPHLGHQQLTLTDIVAGHKPLPKPEVLAYLRS